MTIGKKKATISNRKGLSQDDIVDFLFASGVFSLKEDKKEEAKEKKEFQGES